MSTGTEGDVAAPWTRDGVRELVAGKTVILRDDEGLSRPLPAWMSSVVAAVESEPWAHDLDRTHPRDRAQLMHVWWQALAQPGELQVHVVRRRDEDEIHFWRVEILNLLRDPELGVLIVLEDEGLADSQEWEDPTPAAEFTSTDWVLEHVDEFGNKLWVQGCVESIYGRTSDELVGRPGNDFLNPAHFGDLFDIWVELLTEPEQSKTVRLEVLRPDGSSVWVESVMINRLADERIGAVVCLAHDITQEIEREAEERIRADELRRSQEAFQTLAEQVPTGVFRAKGNGALEFVNQQGIALLGADGALTDLRTGILADDVDGLARCLRRLASPFGPDDQTVEVRSLDGSRVLSIACKAVGHTGGGAREIVGSIIDVTTDQELRHHASHDGLTGVLNRRTIDRYLEELLDARADGVLVAFVDLDGFKQVNDISGHDAGDAVLRDIALRLSSIVRPTDDVGRYGGDEFVLLCRNATRGAEDALASRLRAALTAPVLWPGGRWQPRASIGFARPLPGERAHELLRRADQQMYSAKRATADAMALEALPA
jgi:diguanylate cyclase (GGDEF)-like protein/PAS domain S-box-containing protein